MGEPIYSDTGCTGSTPLVLGVARGLRTFYLDENGWLRGVTYRAVWRDGENIAKCYVARPLHSLVTTTRAFLGARPAPYIMGGVVFDADPDVPVVPEAGHRFESCSGMEATCGCGFYAYHASDQRYATNGPGCRIVGVVEAYGKVILGTAGFRAEKARIVAVVVPPVTEASKNRGAMERTIQDIRDAIEEVQYRAGRKWWRNPLVAAYTGLAVALGAGAALVGAWPMMLLAGWTAACARISHVLARHRTAYLIESLSQDLSQATKAMAQMPFDYSVHVERARAHYPSVEFFESEDELRQAYPVESLAALAQAHRREGVGDDQ